MKHILTGFLCFIIFTVVGSKGVNFFTWHYWVVFVATMALIVVQHM